MKKTVAITGASGFLGGFLLAQLSNTYHVRALARRSIPGAEVVIVDMQDLDGLQVAFQGVDSIVHMAAKASPWETWDDVLPNNIVGTYNVYEAAVRAGVKQVVYASSNHVLGGYEQVYAPDLYRTGQPVLDHNVPLRPDGFYGLSKAFGETMGRYYADYRGLHVLCLRIGYVNQEDMPNPPAIYEDPERLASIWLSQRDCLQLVEKSLQADHVPFDVFYGISNNLPHFYDLEHVREVIGYEPQDGAVIKDVKPRELKPHA